MSQILKLTHENQQLKRQVSQYKQVLGVSPFIDDSVLKGGYRVVKTITDRDKIDCCHRKQGMKVIVVGEDLSFKKYILKTDNCKENIWEEVDVKIELIDKKVQITESTSFANIGQSQKDFNKNVSDYKINTDLKNQEQDGRLSNIENKNNTQDSRLKNLEGINYTWSPTNRTLTLFDNNGTQLSQVSLVSLDNEGTDIRYNASTLSLELYNANNELLDSIPVSSFIGSVGTQLQLNSNQLQLKDSQGNILSAVNFEVSNINGLQSILTGKQDKLSSYDESIIIEKGGNIEGNVSLFEEFFEQQNCVLNFTPIQIIGVYINGIKQKPSSYVITLPKTITISTFVTGDYIEIQYTKLKI